MLRHPYAVLVVGLGLGLVACGSNGDGSGSDAPSLRIAPSLVELTVANRVAVTADFTATLRTADGEERDVTAEARFAIDEPGLGQFSGAVFTAAGDAGGEGTATASFDGLIADATVVVRVDERRVVDPAPADAPGRFEGATEDAALAPTIVYPTSGVIVPPNLGELDVHWTDVAGADLYEVTLRSEYVTLALYVQGNPGAGTFATFPVEDWVTATTGMAGETITASVRAMVSASPGAAGTATPIEIALADTPLEGGLYYWASKSSSGAPEGIYRHDMARAGEPAEIYYTTAQAPDGRCVACHALSRDGERMAITYDGGNGAATVLDVATRTPLMATDGSFKWNFATFDPSGEKLLTVALGALALRDAATGAELATVPTEGYASHPDIAPSGDAITYVAIASPSSDWSFNGGSIVVQGYDAATDSFGAATPLVTGDDGNFYYPSWSPDSAWIVYNRSTQGSYDIASAEVWVARADGSLPPIRLDLPNAGVGLTNSWARWAPFEQIYGRGEDAEPVMWLTFSSKRAFGVRLPAGQPQIWMAPFFPERAARGEPASAPAFRLPFQEMSSNNHIAQWTEQVVVVE